MRSSLCNEFTLQAVRILVMLVREKDLQSRKHSATAEEI